ncbi:MAG TPA: SpoIID/LytB domain-containing protein [Solirubrobacteraceae bacterium]|jgi:stage II sporulation protein D|nr:SpoIID/LytB domain-containing protein [Solirubrobacteraceae bacterium]
MPRVVAVDSGYMRLSAAALLIVTLTGATAATSSHAARATAASSTLVVTGAGYGHGVGMSQEGALGYAEHGYAYQAILAHYYSGTALERVSPQTKVTVLIGAKVHTLPLETYVRGVVGAEMPSSWPLAALEAQAVASRTYALTDHAGGARFDVYADTRSQVYIGVKAHTAQTNAAVAATAGEVVAYAGKPAITYFFASSGGMTESVQNAFPGATPQPWLRGVPDPYDQGEGHRWRLTMSFATAAARLRGLVKGAFRGIEVLRRGYSPRVLAAYVLGSGGETRVSGVELEERLGLDDTWAYFSLRTASGTVAEPDLSHYTAPTGVAPEVTSPETGTPAAEASPPGGASSPAGSSPAPEPAGPEGGTTAGSAPSAGEGGGTTPP